MENKGSVSMQHYEFGKLIGQENFAKVHHARNVKNGSSVVIKAIDKEKIFRVARKYFQQLITVVDFYHSRGVYHRDLKPKNLLVDENGSLKISDFGLSALVESRPHDGLLYTTCGTPAYVDLEVISRKGYDGSKADIWSCGMILFVLLAGYLPFQDLNLMEMYHKIKKAGFKCPNWVSSDVHRQISKMLNPIPKTKISIAKMRENSWFRKGLKRGVVDSNRVCENTNMTTEANQESEKLKNLNAFDIISFFSGFDLSGLFVEKDENGEGRFTSTLPAETIISKLEDIARHLKMKTMKKKGGYFKLEGSKLGRKGVLSIDAEIFEVTPSFHLVEMKKSSGDTLEYQRMMKMMKQDIRPALKDIVWSWQGDQPQPEQLEVTQM